MYSSQQITSIPERSKGADSRSVAYASWVRIPLLVLGVDICSYSEMVITQVFET